MNDKTIVNFIVFGVLSLVALIILIGSAYTIESGERGVLLTFGKASDISIDEGFHLKIPFAQKVKIFEVRTKKLQETADSSSKDLQVVKTTMALNYHINPEMVHVIFKELGPGYEERIIKPATQEATKSAMAIYKADELISKRTEVSVAAKEILVERLAKYNVVVDDFNLLNFDFSTKFDAAIEAKQEAEQQALQAENDLKKKQIDAQVRIAEAEADAESTKARADASAYERQTIAEAEAYALRVVREELSKSKDLIEYRRIEAWEKGGSQVPNTVLGDSSQILMSVQ